MARVLSGIQPSGGIHLGNYLGAIRQFVASQGQDDGFFCIVDLHAITVPQDPAVLRESTLDLAATYLAAGLDPEQVTLFVQSQVPQHAELAWTLGTITGFGELRRMTQFKDKSQKQAEAGIGFGLFAYPVLMAADILIYQADEVPIGDDQRQHLELTRDIAERFNSRFGQTFVVPKPRYTAAAARVMDLQDPNSKMSKSAASQAGVVYLSDPPEVIRKKVMSAVTDTGREIKASVDKPGIGNLLEILSACAGSSVADLESQFKDTGYGDFKAAVADAVTATLDPVRRRIEELRAEPGAIEKVLATGAERARSVASETLAAVYDRVGFLR
ncbi:MAG: tryptophan--tRNA ligase [Actinomycetota bacterium]